jgi:hypothetical protein
MANPDGEDKGKEWFELYNASGQALDLAGVTLVASKADATDAKRHVMSKAALEIGAYWVVGDVASDMLPAHVDYGYRTSLGALRNDTGRLALKCGDVTLDEVIYKNPKSGVALGFSGASVPDHIANDQDSAWCNATTEYEAGALGTPGAQNDACAVVVPPSMCSDQGSLRPVVVPAAGDLVITEIMPNPAKVTDTVGEWFEVMALADVDLNGLGIGNQAGTVADSVSDAACRRVSKDSLLVFARSADDKVNGGLTKVEVVIKSVDLTNSGGSLVLSVGGTVIDQTTWTTKYDGASTALSSTKSTAVGNDDPLNWCKATTTYGAGDKGTPGVANPACPVIVVDGQCLDGDVARPVVSPMAGDLVITEFMANPKAVDDTVGEWFEVSVGRDVDLNGLEIGKIEGTALSTLKVADCLRVTAGSLVVFGRSADDKVNGGLPGVDHVFSFDLVNSASSLYVGVLGKALDAIAWTKTSEGIATSLDPDMALNTTDNDLPASYCPAATTSTYGAGDRGTPGSSNPQCP